MIKRWIVRLAVLGLCWNVDALASYFEISINGSYYLYNNGPSTDANNQNLDFNSITKTHRLGGSIGYHFLTNASIELSYMTTKSQDSFAVNPELLPTTAIIVNRNTEIQNTSLDLVLDFGSRGDVFRPYIRSGVGYMTRLTNTSAFYRIDNTAVSQYTTSSSVSALSANGGVGFKYFVAQQIAIELSGSIYATDLDQPDIYLHYSVSGGLRLLF